MSLWQDFKETKTGKYCTDPAVAFIIAILAIIISFATSYYFYKVSAKVRDLSFYTNPNTTIIVQSNTVSDLAVTYQGQTITNGFYGQQIAIWNEGKEAIETKDILQQIIIKPPSGVQILQPKVAKRSRDLTGFRIVTNTALEVVLTWDILEYRDGGVLQIFYTGNAKNAFTVEGALRDQPKVREWQVAMAKEKGMNKTAYTCLLMLAVGWMIFMYFKTLKSVEELKELLPQGKKIWSKVITTTLTIVAIGGVMYSLHLLIGHVLQQPVPFGL
jgi:hypothetical protein